MDVHPPEHGIHSWRDFFVHMMTICLGLLIAIGLEQSVEWEHHRHERHQLQADLREEGQRNIEVIAADLQEFAAYRAQDLSLRREVGAMVANRKGVAFSQPPQPGRQPTVPSDAVWITAQDSALTALLPRQEAQMYSRLELQHQLLMNSIERWLNVKSEKTAFEENFDDAGLDSQPDYSRMSADELHAYFVLLTKNIATRDEVVFRLHNFLLLDRAILNGAQTEQEMLREATHEKL